MATTFKGKAIYKPAGKAGEYAEWACNFYVGCSNGCTYCFLKKGRGAAVLGGDKPELKKCFSDETHALEVFQKEMKTNLEELQKHGLFFSFTTDPFLPETEMLTFWAIGYAVGGGVPVKMLTKCTGWVDEFLKIDFTGFIGSKLKEMYAFGFTLSGHDELEPGASTNAERIEAMKKLHDAGFKTFASIEPVIDFENSYNMIVQTTGFCDLYKVGLLSGGKYNRKDAQWFLTKVMLTCSNNRAKVYIKDSLINLTGVDRDALRQNHRSYVDRDYNMFNQNTATK